MRNPLYDFLLRTSDYSYRENSPLVHAYRWRRLGSTPEIVFSTTTTPRLWVSDESSLLTMILRRRAVFPNDARRVWSSETRGGTSPLLEKRGHADAHPASRAFRLSQARKKQKKGPDSTERYACKPKVQIWQYGDTGKAWRPIGPAGAIVGYILVPLPLRATFTLEGLS